MYCVCVLFYLYLCGFISYPAFRWQCIRRYKTEIFLMTLQPKNSKEILLQTVLWSSTVLPSLQVIYRSRLVKKEQVVWFLLS